MLTTLNPSPRRRGAPLLRPDLSNVIADATKAAVAMYFMDDAALGRHLLALARSWQDNPATPSYWTPSSAGVPELNNVGLMVHGVLPRLAARLIVAGEHGDRVVRLDAEDALLRPEEAALSRKPELGFNLFSNIDGGKLRSTIEWYQGETSLRNLSVVDPLGLLSRLMVHGNPLYIALDRLEPLVPVSLGAKRIRYSSAVELMIEPLRYRNQGRAGFENETSLEDDREARLTTVWNPDISNAGFDFEVGFFHRVKGDNLPHAKGLHPALDVLTNLGRSGLRGFRLVGSKVYNNRIILHGAARYGSPLFRLTPDRENQGRVHVWPECLIPNASAYAQAPVIRSVEASRLTDVLRDLRWDYLTHEVLPNQFWRCTRTESATTGLADDLFLQGTAIDAHAFALACMNETGLPLHAPVACDIAEIEPGEPVIELGTNWAAKVAQASARLAGGAAPSTAPLPAPKPGPTPAAGLFTRSAPPPPPPRRAVAAAAASPVAANAVQPDVAQPVAPTPRAGPPPARRPR